MCTRVHMLLCRSCTEPRVLTLHASPRLERPWKPRLLGRPWPQEGGRESSQGGRRGLEEGEDASPRTPDTPSASGSPPARGCGPGAPVSSSADPADRRRQRPGSSRGIDAVPPGSGRRWGKLFQASTTPFPGPGVQPKAALPPFLGPGVQLHSRSRGQVLSPAGFLFLGQVRSLSSPV